MKLAFLTLAARTCAWVKAPLEPLPAPAPAPPPPDPWPDLLDGEAHGSLVGEALDDAVGAAELLIDELVVGDAVGAGVAASARSARERDMPDSKLNPDEEVVVVGEADDDAAEDGELDEAGINPLVRSHRSPCSDGEDPDGDPLGEGDAAPVPGPEPDAATATAAGVSIIAAAAAESPIVSRFIAVPPSVTLTLGTGKVPSRLPDRPPRKRPAEGRLKQRLERAHRVHD
ncbi:MAG: hypothetical protein ACTHK4_10700 [Mycobacteriales bacterium]